MTTIQRIFRGFADGRDVVAASGQLLQIIALPCYGFNSWGGGKPEFFNRRVYFIHRMERFLLFSTRFGGNGISGQVLP